MLDTVQVQLEDVDLSGAKLLVQSAPLDMRTGHTREGFCLWETSSGDEIMGSYAYLRDDHFNISVKPVKCQSGGWNILSFVRFEVPKFSKGHNFHPCTEAETKDAFRQAGRLIKDAGIKTNIAKAKPCRVDSFRNAILEEPFKCYGPVLSLLHGRRMEQRGYENGFLWENTRQQLIAYDKIQKMRHDKHSLKDLPPNAMRFEKRLLNASKVREDLGFTSVSDLVKNLDHLRAKYQETMGKQLFCYDADEIHVMVASQIEEDMRFFKNLGKRYWMRDYLMAFGLHHLLQQAPIDVIVEVVEKLAANKMTKSRLKRELRTARFQAESLQFASGSKRTTGELYQELKSKIGCEKSQ